MYPEERAMKESVDGGRLIGAAPQGQVSSQLDQQEKLIAVLQEKVAILTNKLAPVFQDVASDNSGSPEIARPSMVHIAERVDCNSAQINRVIYVIDTLIEGVQI